MAKRLDPLSIDFYELPNGDTFFFNFLTGEDKLICLARIPSLLIIII